MNIATHLDMELPLLLPGIKAQTTPEDHGPFKQMNMVQFNGERYVLFGDLLASGDRAEADASLCRPELLVSPLREAT